MIRLTYREKKKISGRNVTKSNSRFSIKKQNNIYEAHTDKLIPLKGTQD
jgi:hypothetical protein